MNTYTLRLAEEIDKAALEAFLVFNNGKDNRELAHEYTKSCFSNDYRRPVFIIACNGENKIIGAAAYSEELFTVDVWGISWVSVHEDYRSQGIGQALVEKCIESIRSVANKTVTVILSTYPGKTKLYERCGFIKAGHDHEGGCFMIRSIIIVQ